MFHTTLVLVISNSVHDFRDNQFRYCTLCFIHLSFQHLYYSDNNTLQMTIDNVQTNTNN